MSLHHLAIHRGPQVHRTGGSVEAFQGTRLTSASKSCVQHRDPRPRELGKSEYHWCRWGFERQLDSGGFEGFSVVFLAQGLKGLSTFRDSLPIGPLFTDGAGLIS
jgi:hypothetical protein